MKSANIHETVTCLKQTNDSDLAALCNGLAVFLGKPSLRNADWNGNTLDSLQKLIMSELDSRD